MEIVSELFRTLLNDSNTRKLWKGGAEESEWGDEKVEYEINGLEGVLG